MIKRTVGLRPIKYSKLPSDVTIGLFNDSVYERQSLSDAFSKLNIKPTFMTEKEIFEIWNSNQDIPELDFVLLFSHIPHNELKSIWNITGCDQIIKFASFNRIYNQCVYGQDFLWINCNDVNSIEQKIRWDKITLSSSSKLKKPSNTVPKKESLKIGTPPNLPENFTTVSISNATSNDVPEVIETKQDNNPKIQKLVSENNIVNVTDIVDNEEQTWTVSLPKKIIVLDEDLSQVNNKPNVNDDGTCNIL